MRQLLLLCAALSLTAGAALAQGTSDGAATPVTPAVPPAPAAAPAEIPAQRPAAEVPLGSKGGADLGSPGTANSSHPDPNVPPVQTAPGSSAQPGH